MRHRLIPVLGLLALLTVSAATPRAQVRLPGVTAADRAMLRTLRPGHPRLIGLESDLKRMRDMIARDPLARRWRDRLRREAESMLDQPPVEHILIGPRLLDKSRRALDRVYTLALMYRLDGDRRFAERARKELLTVAAFPDWNPSHFLDVAEMTHAVAIGYDWLYDFLSVSERATLRAAIINLGLKPAVPYTFANQWWVTATHNWNQVCNGGMTLGALAIADEEPDLAAYILSHAVESVKRAMASYAPDGGWNEGPGYWNYATRYNVYLLAGLESALGTDFGLSKLTGFEPTGLFRLYFEGPIRRTFNYADGGDREGGASCLFWLARRFNRPLYAWIERTAVTRPDALDLLWFDPRGAGPKAQKLPTAAFYKGIDVVFLRSAWEDPNALFVGFKGGDNRANHSHLDLGTFVLDADGQRWALDLGGDDYNLPGYFGNRRWSYYRLKTEGHNTLTLDGANQNPRGRAPIVAFSSAPARAFAVADLTAGYAGQALRVQRGIAMLAGRSVLVQDEVEADAPVEIVWAMHTPAQVTVNGAKAALTQGSARLTARILDPPGARFDTMPTNPPTPQQQNTGITKLVVRLPGRTAQARLAVLFTPARDSAPAPPALTPLSEWIAAAGARR